MGVVDKRGKLTFVREIADSFDCLVHSLFPLSRTSNWPEGWSLLPEQEAKAQANGPSFFREQARYWVVLGHGPIRRGYD